MKILVVCLDNLGDTVMSTSVLPMLRKVYPGAEIGFWSKDYAAGILEDHSMIDRLHTSDPFWDKSPGHSSGSFFHFLGTWFAIRRARYDVAIILNAEWRRSMACWLAGIRVRVGYDRRKSRRLLTHVYAVPKYLAHFTEEHQLLIESWLSRTLERAVPRIEATPDQEMKGRQWLESVGWKEKRLIVIHPCPGDLKRCWPISYWADLINSMVRHDNRFRFVVLCGPGDVQKIGLDFNSVPKDLYHVLANASFAEIKGVMTVAQLFVGVDSGPGHLAAALGKPVISLFSHTDPDRCGPTGHGLRRVIRRASLHDLTPRELEQTIHETLGQLAASGFSLG